MVKYKGLDKTVYQQKSLPWRVQHARSRALHRRCCSLQNVSSFFLSFKLHMDQTTWRPSSAILWSQANHMNIVCVLIGWQSPTHICQSFTRQIPVYQHEKVGEKVGENRDKFYLSPTVRQHVWWLFLCRSHIPTWVCQHEFANFSLPCEGRLRSTLCNILINTTFSMVVTCESFGELTNTVETLACQLVFLQHFSFSETSTRLSRTQ